jgi:hypothetical protein
MIGGVVMGRTVATGVQDFEKLITEDCFYIDKTDFIREWWESGDKITLITRPRSFGKTLNMSMLNCFFSNRYADRGDLFEGLSIWQHEEYRKLQGTYPVIYLSFSNVLEEKISSIKHQTKYVLQEVYSWNRFLRDSEVLTAQDREYFDSVSSEMSDDIAVSALYQLSEYLCRYYGKKVIILLDEYDTPLQNVYVKECLGEAPSFIRKLYEATFQDNPYLERAMLIGILNFSGKKVAKQSLDSAVLSESAVSVFSDFFNLNVVTTTSNPYGTSFGFTEEEVFQAMDEMGMTEKETVRHWYDGYVFGEATAIYNTWTITQMLRNREFYTHWVSTTTNKLIGEFVQKGDVELKKKFEILLQGGSVETKMEERIVSGQLADNEEAIWSLFVATGYLKVLQVKDSEDGQRIYELALTNLEIKLMFRKMILGWFDGRGCHFEDLVTTLLTDDIHWLNNFMQSLTRSLFSDFDSGTHPLRIQTERFYHGFVLGLIVELRGRYTITSNRESGYGRYDVLLEPLKPEDMGIIIEFKVYDPEDEKTLEDTVASALQQLEEKAYAQTLLDKGIPQERIRAYGFAFEGKKVLIG